MGKPVKLSDELIDAATINAKAEQRSIPRQIEYWARMGKLAEENPDLALGFVKDILIGLEEFDAGEVTEYRFG
ncbi:MAG: ParD-like family protein [Candidatus Thiodiazotropha sp. (ex Dulcina madagascariensis)]|nr:ParD-like family protein [Candidatus Thiodiazotropha sp. (ex Dulcina madagascariensis)]MCU7927118.1 ParD-like family protein [Candidatus Thiodiazotropha sp. (ex Dulcina madagascariensis)]